MFFHPRKVSILNIYRLSTSFFCLRVKCSRNPQTTGGENSHWKSLRSSGLKFSPTFRATWTFIFISLGPGSHQPRGRCWGKIVHGKVIESLWRSRGVRSQNFQEKIFLRRRKSSDERLRGRISIETSKIATRIHVLPVASSFRFRS